jgi:molecular chaperone GrpE
MNNDNNLGMAGENGVQESPSHAETAGAPGTDTADASPDTITHEGLTELRAKAAKADEHWDKYVRSTADFDNFKKRAARERTEAIRYANEGLLEKRLPIGDNFEAALAAANASATNVESLKTGVQMIYTQLKSFLSDAGLEEIDALGKAFDPNLHEAVSQQPSAEVQEGQVLQQMRKGYKYRDRLIRPAMVVVAKKP